MNKNHRIVASSVFFVVGAVLTGYGFAAIDFAFGDDRWGREGQGMSDFPLIGTMPTESAFQLGMIAVLSGFLFVIAGARIAIANYSTIKNLWKIIAGILLIAWAIWGTAFAFNTITYRVLHDIDEVGIPCFADNADESSKCTFTSEEWLFINFAMMGIGLLMVILGTKQSRVVTMH